MATHDEHILDQFTRLADVFATAPALTSHQSLDLLIRTAATTPNDTVLDVGCGAGVVTCAFAAVARQATGIDLVPAMIERARALALEKQLTNVHWRVSNVVPLPFPDASFSIVVSRYAFHHFEYPHHVLAEMARVCAPGGRVLVADMAAPEDAAKAAALNQLERLRDPSHVRGRPVSELIRLFAGTGLMPQPPLSYRLELDLESLLKGSHPLPGNEAAVREILERALLEDTMDLKVTRQPDGIHLSYPIAVLVAQKA